MANYYDIFINYKRTSQTTANCWSCSNKMLLSFSFADFMSRLDKSSKPVCAHYTKSFLGEFLVLLWLSYRALRWIRSVFLDGPSGRSTFGRLQGKKAECEEGSMVMRRYTLFTNLGSLPHEVGMAALRN